MKIEKEVIDYYRSIGLGLGRIGNMILTQKISLKKNFVCDIKKKKK